MRFFYTLSNLIINLLAYCDKQGLTKVEHFITVDKYIQLLFIELNIRNMYKETAA
jgi:hypothetical protein